MTFGTFITQVFDFFHQFFQFFIGVFNLLITNNFIKLSLCIGVILLIIDYQFNLIGFFDDIFGFSNPRDRELRNDIKGLKSSVGTIANRDISGGSYKAVFDKNGNTRVIQASYYGNHKNRGVVKK